MTTFALFQQTKIWLPLYLYNFFTAFYIWTMWIWKDMSTVNFTLWPSSTEIPGARTKHVCFYHRHDYSGRYPSLYIVNLYARNAESLIAIQSTLSKWTPLYGGHGWLVQTLYKVNTSLRWTVRADPEGVCLRESSLYQFHYKNLTITQFLRCPRGYFATMQQYYSRTSTNGHLSTTARIFHPSRTSIHTFHSCWNLPATTTSLQRPVNSAPGWPL